MSDPPDKGGRGVWSRTSVPSIGMHGYRLEEISDGSLWHTFLSVLSHTPFPQSWAWGEFQKSQGHDVKRLAFFSSDANHPALIAQLIRYARGPSGYWFAPRGPVVFQSYSTPETQRNFLRELQLPGHSIFYRFEPCVSDFDTTGFIRARAMSPASTMLIDLTQNEDEILSRMHPKTRYNIRIAEREGVTVREGKDARDLEAFLALLKETATRDKFLSQPAAYLRAMNDVLKNGKMSRVRLAEKDGRALAGSLEIWYGDTVTYLHGASSSQERQLMAPYALHWNAICAAKNEGFSFYDLWGCNPKDKTQLSYKQSWEGITRFKSGFGGERMDFIGTWDLPKHPWLYRWLVRSRV